MPVQIDHIVIAGSDLTQLRAQAEARGMPSVEGGVHVGGQTHNALVGFPDGTYLELIAPTPGNTAPDHAWSAFMRNNAGMSAWAIRSADIEADVAVYRSRGIAVSDPVSGGRTRMDGVRLEWRTAKLGNDVLGAVLPFLIQDLTPRDLRAPKPMGIHEKLVGVEAVVFDVTDDKDPYVVLLRQAFGSALVSARDEMRLDKAPVYFNISSEARGLRDMRLYTR